MESFPFKPSNNAQPETEPYSGKHGEWKAQHDNKAELQKDYVLYWWCQLWCKYFDRPFYLGAYTMKYEL